jgi:hypothetical protein
VHAKKILLTAGALVTVAAVAVTSLALGRQTHHPKAPSLIVAQSDQLLPSESLTDIVTYSDHVVRATVVSEAELPMSAEEIAAGEGMAARVITLRIDAVLWSRGQAPAAPTSFRTDLDGWSVKQGHKTPLRLEGEPMMVVGKQYVLPIVYLSKTAKVSVPGWSALSPNSIFPVQKGILGNGDTIPGELTASRRQADHLRGPFFGSDVAKFVSAVRSSRPDPAVADAMNLPPDVRVQHAGSR